MWHYKRSLHNIQLQTVNTSLGVSCNDMQESVMSRVGDNCTYSWSQVHHAASVMYIRLTESLLNDRYKWHALVHRRRQWGSKPWSLPLLLRFCLLDLLSTDFESCFALCPFCTMFCFKMTSSSTPWNLSRTRSCCCSINIVIVMWASQS